MRKLMMFLVVVATFAPLSATADTHVWDMDASEDQVSNSGVGDGSTDSPAAGHGAFRYDDTTGLLFYDVGWTGLAGLLTAIHVHGPAGPGENNSNHFFNIYTGAPDVIAAGVDRTSDNTSSTVALLDIIVESAAQDPPDIVAAALLDEQGYLNIHSDIWPSGEIRADFVFMETLSNLTKEQQKCSAAMKKGFAKLADAQSKTILACIKDAANGSLSGTIEECTTADARGKVGKAAAKVSSGFDKKCPATLEAGYPSFGSGDPATVVADVQLSAVAKELNIIHRVFGADLDAAVVTEADDAASAGCQRAIGLATNKCQKRLLSEYGKCNKKGLKGRGTGMTLVENTQVGACLGADPKSKIAKTCNGNGGKLARAVDGSCAAPVALDTTFPGCNTTDAAALAECIDASIRCEACIGVSTADGTTIDCELFDNGLGDASCMD